MATLSDRRLLQLAQCLLFVVGLLATLASMSAVHAQISGSDTERQVKAAYLLKFGNFIEWPAASFSGADQPFKIGIVGADMLADELTQMATGRSVNGRPISVRKLRRDDVLGDFNIVFIGQPAIARLAELPAGIKGRATLVVTDSERALEQGSMINFVLADGRLRFEVAPKNAGVGNISISARLLAAAFKVAAEPS